MGYVPAKRRAYGEGVDTIRRIAMRLRTVSILITAAALTVGTASVAKDMPASNVAGNTIEADYGKERVAFFMAADGTFTARNPQGGAFSGDWLTDGRYLCWITKSPKTAPGENFRCEALDSTKKVGDSWTHTDIYGESARVTIKAGNQLERK